MSYNANALEFVPKNKKQQRQQPAPIVQSKPKFTEPERRVAKKRGSKMRNLASPADGRLDITGLSPLRERVLRTRFDPAHCEKYAMGMSATQRTITNSSTFIVPITVPAGKGMWIYSLPFLECPIMTMASDTSIGTGYYDVATFGNTPAAAMDILKAEAFKTIGKSMTLKDVTQTDSSANKMPMQWFRMNPSFKIWNEWNGENYYISSGGTNTAVDQTSQLNVKILQNIPQLNFDISTIGGHCDGGGYLVSEIVDEAYRRRVRQSDGIKFTAPSTNAQMDQLKTTNPSNTEVSLGNNVVYDTAQSAMAANTRVCVSMMDNSDLCGFFIPATDIIKSYQVTVHHHVQYLTADMKLLGSRVADEPYYDPDVVTESETINAMLSGIYPPEWNDWAGVWSGIKRGFSNIVQGGKKAVQVGKSIYKFVQEHPELVKAASSVVKLVG